MDVRLPKLGEGADSGTVVTILVKEGDSVAKEQPLLELETEKAVGTIPSSAAGKVTKIHVKVGDKITAGQVILALEGGEVAGPTPAPVQKAPATADGAPAVVAAVPTGEYRYESKSGLPPPASPSVRKVARELGIDLTRVKGTESGGRISMADLRAYIQWLQTAAQQPKTAQPPAPAVEKIDFAKWGPVTRKPLSSLRRVIGRRMTEAWTTIPHVTQFDEADITELMALKKKYDAAYEKKGAKLTVTGFVLKALVVALKKHPLVNASLDEAAGEIVLKNYIHIGVAVDTEHGLIVPVLRDVDRKSLLAISVELDQLGQKTRERKVTSDELKGGSFTVSNLGGMGVGLFTPIINKPEVAILGVGRGALKPVVKGDKLVHRILLPLALSYDHRVIDGADGARFIREVATVLENFKESEVKI